ncbi:MAG: hypothetical protein J6X56_02580 [Ruminococcus sp.]|nr:hypothetical protein [Ruminococcus sp.]
MKNDVSKKKKNSKEKRILIASLCIAAAVIAGSTFAWFSSTDDVTNRLSANADYGVSIVESFAPPENWMPGSLVNKDVYATNTGNIGAFVNEDISCVLTITTERPVATWSADCVELTTEERYVMEAGSFLAFKPDGSTAKLGDQIVIRPDDQGDPPTTDFTPDVDGLYVFRRSIVVAGNNTETFTYEGYYYSGGKYYKISDLETTPDTTPDLANDGVRTDGNLSAATSGYYKLEQQTINPVALEYDATNHRLVASYDTGINTATPEEKQAAAEAYDEAIHDYQMAIEKQARAASESSAADAGVLALYNDYVAANNALNTALNDLATATTNQANAQAAYDALSSEKTTLEGQRDSLLDQMYGQHPGSESNYVADTSLYARSIKDIGTASDNQRLKDEVNAWLASGSSGVENAASKTFDDLTYAELSTYTPTNDTHTYYQDYVAKTKAQEDYTALKSQYDTIATRLTAIGDDTTAATEMKAAYDALTAANTAYDDADDDVNNPTTGKQKLRDDAYDAWDAALTAAGLQTGNLADANAELASATAAYNTAKKAYEKAVAAPTSSDLKLYINLNNDVVAGGTADKWQLLPSTIDDNTAHFYYTSILGPGETSAKLIDSVELDSATTQDMYKSFDFDVNVALKSAQITYAEDQTTILGTAATSEIGKTPTLTDATDINTALTWN